MVLSAGGYLLTSEAIRRDRDAAAERRAQVESVRTQALLGRARAYVAGLGNVLANEPAATARRFAALQTNMAGSVGLSDALWVERVAASERAAYERRVGAPIDRLLRGGGFGPAPRAPSYLAATFTSGTRPELRRGVDVSDWPELAAAIRDRALVFAVSATRASSLGGQRGFYLLEAGSFGPGNRGFLVVFVPGGWLTTSLELDPQHVAVSLDGRRLEGQLQSTPAAGGSFDALAQHWEIGVDRDPPTSLDRILPWLALVWPITAALVAFLVGHAIARRRRAERDAERIFDLSLDLLCVGGLDGYFKRVNPAFERTLGYTREQLLSRPFAEFIHPEDRERTSEALAALAEGTQVIQFENRYVCSDGSVRWLQWSSRPMPREGLVYAAARDVTTSRLLADEQAALRRVATLVAQGAPPPTVFDAVVGEMSRLLDADATTLLRYEPDGTAAVAATYSTGDGGIAAGARLSLEGTATAGRIDTFAGPPGSLGAVFRQLGVQSAVVAPIGVEGRPWGVMTAAWTHPQPLHAGSEGRMAQFTEIVATAVANAESQAELTASRARVVTAADETRRRIERDLHDGTQQRLISLALALRGVEDTVPDTMEDLREELSDIAHGLTGAVEDLVEISRGIHPGILSQGGLAPALKALARRSAVAVDLDMDMPQRLPERIEVAAYYIVSEALTNATKHAHASVVRVAVAATDSILELAVRDDGVGGADPAHGSGLIGLRDRVEALGGTIEIASEAGTGTSLRATLPLD